MNKAKHSVTISLRQFPWNRKVWLGGSHLQQVVSHRNLCLVALSTVCGHARLVLLLSPAPLHASYFHPSSAHFKSKGKQTSNVIPLLFARKPTTQVLTLARWEVDVHADPSQMSALLNDLQQQPKDFAHFVGCGKEYTRAERMNISSETKPNISSRSCISCAFKKKKTSHVTWWQTFFF